MRYNIKSQSSNTIANVRNNQTLKQPLAVIYIHDMTWHDCITLSLYIHCANLSPISVPSVFIQHLQQLQLCNTQCPGDWRAAKGCCNKDHRLCIWGFCSTQWAIPCPNSDHFKVKIHKCGALWEEIHEAGFTIAESKNQSHSFHSHRSSWGHFTTAGWWTISVAGGWGSYRGLLYTFNDSFCSLCPTWKPAQLSLCLKTSCIPALEESKWMVKAGRGHTGVPHAANTRNVGSMKVEPGSTNFNPTTCGFSRNSDPSNQAFPVYTRPAPTSTRRISVLGWTGS